MMLLRKVLLTRIIGFNPFMLLLLLSLTFHCNADIVINEVAVTPVITSTCSNSNSTLNTSHHYQYIELYNTDTVAAVDISSYEIRCDVLGNETLIRKVPDNTTIRKNGIAILCGNDFLISIVSDCMIKLYQDDGTSPLEKLSLPSNGFSSTLTYSRKIFGGFDFTMSSPNTENIFYSQYYGTIFINEVAATPTPNYFIDILCMDDSDWVELINIGVETVELAGFLLHDDQGATSADAYTFTDELLEPGKPIVVCRNEYISFAFDIDSNDTITLLDSNGDFISSTGIMPNGSNATLTYQLGMNHTNTTYIYARPSPFRENFADFDGSTLFINEVASSSTSVNVCDGNDWIELITTGDTPVELAGLVLHDDKGPNDTKAFTFTFSSLVYPYMVYMICGQPSNVTNPSKYSFHFDIDSNDTISLIDYNGNIISTTGMLPNGGNTKSTYQRTRNGTYMYGYPTPFQRNFPIYSGAIYINEVASTPTTNGSCDGNDWIEIINVGNVDIDLAGLVLHDDRGPTNNESYTFDYDSVIIQSGYFIICGQPSNSVHFDAKSFIFDIDSNDTISLIDSYGGLISTTGVLTNSGSATSTYQRTTNNTYMYGAPTQNRENLVVFVGSIYINEVATTPTPNSGFCKNNDWIEVINVGDTRKDLAGLYLEVDRGPNNSTFFMLATFDTSLRSRYLRPGQLRVYCGSDSDSFNSNDTIILRDYNDFIVATTGVLPNEGSATLTLQRTSNNNTYMYGSPSFNEENFLAYIGSVLINEVASSPTPYYDTSCYGSSWIELYTTGDKNINMTGYKLHDDRGPNGSDVFTFGVEYYFFPGVYILICQRPSDINDTNPFEFNFNIDGNDTISLLNADGVVISSTGILTNGGNESSTYQRIADSNNTYMYGLPTPLQKNIQQNIAPVQPPAQAPVLVPVIAPVVPVSPISAPAPITVTTPIVSPVSTPILTPILAPALSPISSPILLPVSTPISAPSKAAPIIAPISLPVSTPLTAPVAIPISVSVVPIPSPIKTPVTQPVPLNVPNQVPTNIQPTAPITTPTIIDDDDDDDDCGLFGFKFFCPRRNECGFWRRLFNIGNC